MGVRMTKGCQDENGCRDDKWALRMTKLVILRPKAEES